MKASFALLALIDSAADTGSSQADAEVDKHIFALKAAAEVMGSEIVNYGEAGTLPELIFSKNFVIICGSCSPERLFEHCKTLKDSSVWPIVAVDAFTNGHNLHQTFSELEARLVQLSKTPAIIGSLRSGSSFIYPYAKADCTASVCLLFDNASQALVIERLHEPFQGKDAFPGGFLRVMLETMEDAAYRELEEECSLRLDAGELSLVDIRSAPARDPRAHIVDAGYAANLDEKRKQELMLQLKAGDDAGSVHLRSVKELLEPGALAFDHRDFLLNTLKFFRLQID